MFMKILAVIFLLIVMTVYLHYKEEKRKADHRLDDLRRAVKPNMKDRLIRQGKYLPEERKE